MLYETFVLSTFWWIVLNVQASLTPETTGASKTAYPQMNIGVHLPKQKFSEGITGEIKWRLNHSTQFCYHRIIKVLICNPDVYS